MRIFYTLSLIVSAFLVQGQTMHAEIPLKDIVSRNNQLEMQGLEFNDSIFIAGYSSKNEPAKAFWILPSGKVVKLDSQDFGNKLIVGLATSGDSIYFYYLEQIKNYTLLKAVVQNLHTGTITTSNKNIVFNGTFVSMFRLGKHVYLLSILRDQNEIYLSEIRAMERLRQISLAGRLDLNTNPSPFSFVSENEILSPLAAASPNKIYQKGSFIYVGIDKSKIRDGTPAMTLILKINIRTGESEVRTIIDTSGKQFRTYIYNDYIFKITKSRSSGAIITIYDLGDFSIKKSLIIDKETAMAKNRSFKKDFAKTIDKESVWDAVSNNANGFITAISTDSTNFIIRVGSHHVVDRSGAGFIPILSQYPILAIVGAMARITALSLSEPESVDQYLYLTWDGINGPAFADQPRSAIQAVDAYEVEKFKRNSSFKYKGYLQRHSKTFGIYLEPGSASVNIILFKNP